MQITSQMTAAAEIIKDGILAQMAAKNGITVDEVVAALDAGNEKAFAQFDAFARAGVHIAVTLAAAGHINLGV
jgi:hypothetical protein